MRAAGLAFGLLVLGGCAVAPVTETASTSRPWAVVVAPFDASSLAENDRWVGEGIAQIVSLGLAEGVAHQTLGNRWKAAAQFRAAWLLDPLMPEPHKALGDLFLGAPRSLVEPAIAAYSRAIQLRPFYADAYVGLGDAKAAKGDTDGAIAAYGKAQSFDPFNAAIRPKLEKLTGQP